MIEQQVKSVVTIRNATSADVTAVFVIRAAARRLAYRDFLSPKSWRSFEIQNATTDDNLAKWHG